MTAIIFDTETHDKVEPEIIEAAMIDLYFGNPTGIIQDSNKPVWSRRFQPSKPVALGAMATHGIMDEDLIGCDPSSSFEFPKWCDVMIGHNVDFDWEAAGKPEWPKRIDTCAMAHECWPALDCYSQIALIYHLDRKNARERLKGAHGAAADVFLCKTILDACIAHSGVQSWEELYAFSEEARIPKVMGFGKHKGMAIGDLPRDYVSWLLRATDPPIDEYLRRALTGETKQRTLL